MQLDAWISMLVFTIATVAFYFLGAAVLHPQGLDPKGPEMIPTLSRMYLQPLEGTPLAALRPFTYVGFLLGAWAVLFKTLYVATAANSRMTADFLSRLGVWHTDGPAQRDRVVKLFCVIYPTLSLGLYYAFREPQGLIKAGGIAQALMLPFIAGATIYLRRRETDRRVGPVAAERYLDLDRLRGDHGRRGLQHLRPGQGNVHRARSGVNPIAQSPAIWSRPWSSRRVESSCVVPGVASDVPRALVRA